MSKNVKNHSQQKVEVKVESTCRMIHAGWTSVTKDQEYKSFLDVGIDELSCKIRFHKAVPLKQAKTIINKDSKNIHAILQKAATFFWALLLQFVGLVLILMSGLPLRIVISAGGGNEKITMLKLLSPNSLAGQL